MTNFLIFTQLCQQESCQLPSLLRKFFEAQLSMEIGRVEGLGIQSSHKRKFVAYTEEKKAPGDSGDSGEFRVGAFNMNIAGVNSLNNAAELTLRANSVTPGSFLKLLDNLMKDFLDNGNVTDFKKLSDLEVPEQNESIKGTINDIQLLLAAEAAHYSGS